MTGSRVSTLTMLYNHDTQCVPYDMKKPLTPQQQGDDNEAFCKAYILDHFAPAKQKLIEDTKYNSVHGIDFAFTTNNGKELFIVEVKGAKAQISKGQMSNEWLLNRITKLQHHNPHSALLVALKNTLASNGTIKGMTYKVNKHHTTPVRLMNPAVFFKATELTQLAALLNQPLSSNISSGEQTMANSIEHQIELLTGLKSYLENFQEKLLGVSENYQRKVDALESEDNLISNIHRNYSEQQLEPTRNSLSNIVNQISDNDIPAIENYIAWLEALPKP